MTGSVLGLTRSGWWIGDGLMFWFMGMMVMSAAF